MSREPVRPLDSLVTLVTERVVLAKDPAKPYVGLEHIPSGGTSLKQVGSSADSISTNGVFAPGDILFGKLRPRLRKSVRATQAGYCSTDVLVLRAQPGTDPSFAGFVTQSDEVFRRAIQTEEGTKMPRCSWRDLRVTSVFAPESVVEQQRIAAILTSLDTAIETTEALIEKHKQIKAGLMRDLLMRGIQADGRTRPTVHESPEEYVQHSIGWIPRAWTVGRLADRVEVIDPNPSHRYPPPTDDGVAIASTENFAGDDAINLERSARVPWSTFHEQNARCRFKLTDVVFARKGQIGLARRYGEEPKVFSHTVVLLKPIGNQCHAGWLLWAVRSEWVLGYIDRTMNSNSGVPTLGVANIKDVPLPFPPLLEQQQIASSLDSASQVLHGLEVELGKLRMQKRGLMQDLLTGKVPVRAD